MVSSFMSVSCYFYMLQLAKEMVLTTRTYITGKKKTFNNSVNQFYHNSFRAPKCQPIDAYPEAFLHSHRSKSIIPICPTDITPDDEDEVETLANHRHPHHKKSTTND